MPPDFSRSSVRTPPTNGMMRLTVVVAVLGLFCGCHSARRPGAPKLGMYTGFVGDEADLLWDLVQYGQPAVIKVTSQGQDLINDSKKVKQLSPDTTVTCGICYPDKIGEGNATEGAQKWLDCAKDAVTQAGCDLWDAWNEPPDDIPALTWMAEFEQVRCKLMSDNNYHARCIVGNFGTGGPDVNNPQAWPAFYPAVRAAIKYGGALGVHEYSFPDMWSVWDGGNPWNNSETGWLTCRYRKVYNNYLQPAGLGDIRIVVNEGGIDNGGGPDKGGFRAFNHTPAQYISELMWYDEALRADSYIVGLSLFASGIGGWPSFNLHPGGLPLYTAYLAQGP